MCIFGIVGGAISKFLQICFLIHLIEKTFPRTFVFTPYTFEALKNQISNLRCKIIFAHWNLSSNFKVLKPWQICAFLKLDLIWKISVLSPWIFISGGLHIPLFIKRQIMCQLPHFAHSSTSATSWALHSFFFFFPKKLQGNFTKLEMDHRYPFLHGSSITSTPIPCNSTTNNAPNSQFQCYRA